MQDYSVTENREEFQQLVSNALINAGADKVFVLCDKNTYENCFPVVENAFDPGNTHTLVFPPGEGTKDVQFLSQVWESLIDAEASRQSLLVNFGGGMITDLGGMAAATFKRGIPFMHVPTTLLAMTDAAFGGKTGINVNGLKNQAGTFTYPRQTITYTGFLQSLPFREHRSGFAEMLKHGVMFSANHWEKLSRLSPENIEVDAGLIRESVDLKQKITSEDFRESGLRELLNFGHTAGHALESAAARQQINLLHGEAVAAGMIIETFIAFEKGLITDAEKEKIAGIINIFFPKLNQCLIFDDELVTFMRADKKNRQGAIRFSLPLQPGKGEWGHYATDEQIAVALKKYDELPCIAE